MNKHLELVREFHKKYGIAQPDFPETLHLSDMDIIMRQALLLECGSELHKAIAIGELSKILAGLVDLAYNALAAIACRGDDVVAVPVNWRQDGSVLSVARAVSEKINLCISGETVHYSGLYALCKHLALAFINADFDQALRLVHQQLMSQPETGSPKNYAQRIELETLGTAPDLSSALYE